jgi:RNA polymerase-binding protein DksA
MKDEAFQIFRHLLLRQVQTLVDQYRLGGIPGGHDGSSDTVDQPNIEIEKDLFFHFQERDRRAIEEIYQALKRIESGSFGICDHCEEEIPHQRLMANPTATLCMNCQKRKEQTERRHGLNGKRSLKLLGA